MSWLFALLHACVADSAAGSLRGTLQPHHPLRPPNLLQLRAQAALQEHLLLLPAAHLQAEGREAALHRRDSHHGHLQIHLSLQLRRVQLSDARHPPEASRLCGPSSPRLLLQSHQGILDDYWVGRQKLKMPALSHSPDALTLSDMCFSVNKSHAKYIFPAYAARQDKLLLAWAWWSLQKSTELIDRPLFFAGTQNSFHMSHVIKEKKNHRRASDKQTNGHTVWNKQQHRKRRGWVRTSAFTWAKTCGPPIERHLWDRAYSSNNFLHSPRRLSCSGVKHEEQRWQESPSAEQ